MKYMFYILLAAGIFSACQPAEKPAISNEEKVSSELADPVFTYKNISQNIGDCADKQFNCAEISIQYPFFTGSESKKLNLLMKEIILNPMLQDYASESAYQDFVNQFLESYKKRRPEPDDSLGWYDHRKMHVMVHSHNLISLQYDENTFSGGAHPNHVVYFKNIALPATREISYSSIWKEGSEEQLSQLCEQNFRKQLHVPDSLSLKEAGYLFDEDKFKLTENVGITPDGCIFLYNPYEIAPLAMGPVKVFVPFVQVKDLLNPNSPVADLAKMK